MKISRRREETEKQAMEGEARRKQGGKQKQTKGKERRKHGRKARNEKARRKSNSKRERGREREGKKKHAQDFGALACQALLHLLAVLDERRALQKKDKERGARK